MNQDTNMQAWMSQLVMQWFQVLSSYAIAVAATFVGVATASTRAVALLLEMLQLLMELLQLLLELLLVFLAKFPLLESYVFSLWFYSNIILVSNKLVG